MTAQIRGLSFDGLGELGRREADAGLPDAGSMRPWPTPTISVAFEAGQQELFQLAETRHAETGSLEIRVAQAGQGLDALTKGVDAEAGRDSNRLGHDVEQAAAALSAAEIRLASALDVFAERSKAICAAGNARIAAIWRGNLSARTETDRLLIAGLVLPKLVPLDELGDD
jgi:hypothetical protein